MTKELFNSEETVCQKSKKHLRVEKHDFIEFPAVSFHWFFPFSFPSNFLCVLQCSFKNSDNNHLRVTKTSEQLCFRRKTSNVL